MKTIEQVKAMVAVLPEEQQQLLKDTIVYGSWGDTEVTFINEEGEHEDAMCMGYITNDAKMAGNFSGRKISAMFRSIYNKMCPVGGYGKVISHISDWWCDGSGDVLFIHTDWVDAFEAWAREKPKKWYGIERVTGKKCFVFDSREQVELAIKSFPSINEDFDWIQE